MIIIDIVEEYSNQSEQPGLNKMSTRTYRAGTFDPQYGVVTRYHRDLLQRASEARQLAESRSYRKTARKLECRNVTTLSMIVRFARRYAQALASWL